MIRNIVKQYKYKRIINLINKKYNIIYEYKDDELIQLNNYLLENCNNLSKDILIIESFSIIKTLVKKIYNIEYYDEQLLAAIYMVEGYIIEMETGEGKTLVAPMVAYYNYLLGNKVYIMTSNNYLAERDMLQVKPIFNFLKITIDCIKPNTPKKIKKESYLKDIVYADAQVLTFDHLRDLIVKDLKNELQVDKKVMIIDEIDSILLDKGNSPLVLSNVSKVNFKATENINNIVKKLDKKDYNIDETNNSIILKDSGILKLEKKLNFESLYNKNNEELLHYIENALKANYLFFRDKDYIIENNKIVAVNRETGRRQELKRFGDGLHQAIEVKEGLKVTNEVDIIAKTTYNKYIKTFKYITGMSGTIESSEEEFQYIYNLSVKVIPRHKKNNTINNLDRVFLTKEAKYKAIIEDICMNMSLGRPMLIGTNYIYETEEISKILTEKNINHNVLNAKQTKYEADIISKAGQVGSITIATNMAGRGTDIKLSKEALKIEGLYVISNSRNLSRRIDKQLAGRTGRQGNIGEVQFFTSLEDEIFTNLNEELRELIMSRILKEPFDDKFEFLNREKLSKEIENLQRVHETNKFSSKKYSMKFESINDIQFNIFYEIRVAILNSVDLNTYNLMLNSILNKLDLNKKDLGVKLNYDMNILEEDFISFKKIKLEKIDKLWIIHLDLLEQLKKELKFYSMGKMGRFNLNKPLDIYRVEAFKLFDSFLEKIIKILINN